MGMRLNVGIENFKHGQGIQDIVVPEKLRERHSSGMDWLDDALGGKGFVPGTVMMLTGTPGAGKSTLLEQLADSLQGNGHQALLNTGEESLYQVKLVCERLGLKNNFSVGQDIMVPEVLKHVTHIMETRMGKDLDKKGRLKVGSKQMFLLIDSLQTMDDGYYAKKDGSPGGTTGATPMRVVEMLTDFAKKTFVNVVFIGQVNKSGEFSGKMGIKHAIDTHAHLFIDTKPKSEFFMQRLFEIQKNRFGCSGRTYWMGLDSSGLFERGRFHSEELQGGRDS